MIDLKNTDWVLSADLAKLNGKLFSVLDENKLLLDGTIEGTINIKDDIINIDIPNYHFSGHIVEGFIFGDVLHDKQSYSFECNCTTFESTNVYMSECKKLNFGDSELEINAIQNVYNLIKDYRIEYSDGSRMSKSRIKIWINQFEEKDRLVILNELVRIFDERYVSFKYLFVFFKNMIGFYREKFKFESDIDFLLNSQFLALQRSDKSQSIMLSHFDNFLNKEYEISLSYCGIVSNDYSFYLDDVLCTGQTFYNNFADWVKCNFKPDLTNKKALISKETRLIGTYIFIHKKNFYKKTSQIGHNFSRDIPIQMWGIWIDNTDEDDSAYEVLQPSVDIEDSVIEEYRENITKEVDTHCTNHNYKIPKAEFYRPHDKPKEEKLFSTPENRNIVEKAFLKKGIEILSKSSITNKNMRALGYSIPSHKNFGFGALCFTWRNIPNNTPLVFWYSGGGFTPLFDVRKSNSSALVDFANFVVE